MRNNLVSLPLDPRAAAADADLLRRSLDESLATLAGLLSSTDVPPPPEVLASIDRCRARIAGGAADGELAALTARACDAARGVAGEARQRTAEQRSQIAAVVAMVRETVATIAGDQTQLQATLDGSAARFERLTRVDDLAQLQRQLVQEVAQLKQISVERRAAWERTYSEFGRRLTTLETQLDHTRREAALDPLTEVANRRAFERVCAEWLGPNRPGFVLGVIDVDDFKRINDSHGHAVGDRVLVTVAKTLARSIRADDVVARLGGDEFAIMALNLTLPQAEGRLATIGRSIQDACRALVPDGAAPSISTGLAECSAGDTVDSLLERADTALYQAKRAGRGRVATKASPFLRDLRGDRRGGPR